MNRILIVEDDRDIAGNLLLLLKKEGFTAVAVGTREESLEQIQRESFDLVLLDLMLPDGNGYSVCTAIKREAQETGQEPVWAAGGGSACGHCEGDRNQGRTGNYIVSPGVQAVSGLFEPAGRSADQEPVIGRDMGHCRGLCK